MADNNDKLENLKKRSTGTAIFTTDMGTGKEGNITPLGSAVNTDKLLENNKVQSAGAPGSAGMVGSKRWIAAHTDQQGKMKSDTEKFT